MKVNTSNDRAYDDVAEEILKQMEQRGQYDDTIIVSLRTDVLGETTVIMNRISCFADKFEWDNDWYEGGEVELLGYIPLSEIVCDAENIKGWISL